MFHLLCNVKVDKTTKHILDPRCLAEMFCLRASICLERVLLRNVNICRQTFIKLSKSGQVSENTQLSEEHRSNISQETRQHTNKPFLKNVFAGIYDSVGEVIFSYFGTYINWFSIYFWVCVAQLEIFLGAHKWIKHDIEYDYGKLKCLWSFQIAIVNAILLT